MQPHHGTVLSTVAKERLFQRSERSSLLGTNAAASSRVKLTLVSSVVIANSSSLFHPSHRSAKHSDRSLWQGENSPTISCKLSAHRRMVRIGVTIGPIVDPPIRLAAPGR